MPIDDPTNARPPGPDPWWGLPPERPVSSTPPTPSAPCGGTTPAGPGATASRRLPLDRRSAHPARRARRVSAASAGLAGLFLTGFFAARGAAAGTADDSELAVGPVGTTPATNATASTVTNPTVTARPSVTTTPRQTAATAPAAAQAPTATSATSPTTTRSTAPSPTTASTAAPSPRTGRTAAPATPGATPRSSSRAS